MIWIQFYKRGCITGSPIEAVGSDGILHLDGRWSRARQRIEAETAMQKRGFIGYTIMRGETYTRSFALTLPKFSQTCNNS